MSSLLKFKMSSNWKMSDTHDGLKVKS